jgi:hypothetical protein
MMAIITERKKYNIGLTEANATTKLPANLTMATMIKTAAPMFAPTHPALFCGREDDVICCSISI